MQYWLDPRLIGIIVIATEFSGCTIVWTIACVKVKSDYELVAYIGTCLGINNRDMGFVAMPQQKSA